MHPVHADFDGHDFHSNGIAFEDYARMSTQRHCKLNYGRHTAAPDWVFNDSKLRAVIVGCIEARAYMHSNNYIPKHGTHAERLARAQQALAAKRPNLEARIDGLCQHYMNVKRAGDMALAAKLAQKVEEVDTQLRLLDEPAKYYVGAAYYYWRTGLDSVATAQQLHIKPPHVRALLWRMGKVAGQLGYGAPKIIRHGPKKMPTEDLLAVAKAVIEKNRRQQISAKLRGRPRPEFVRQKISKARKGWVIPETQRQKISASLLAAKARQGTQLIPYADRLPLVVKMFHAGAKRTEIAAALGWGKSGRCQNGTGMVKRLLIQADLVTA